MAPLQVRLEQTVVGKSHPTDVAYVRLLLGVDPLVNPIGFVRFEPLAADFALESAFLRVDGHVLLELGPTGR